MHRCRSEKLHNMSVCTDAALTDALTRVVAQEMTYRLLKRAPSGALVGTCSPGVLTFKGFLSFGCLRGRIGISDFAGSPVRGLPLSVCRDYPPEKT